MSIPEEVHIKESIRVLSRKVLQNGMDSLSAQERFDLNTLNVLGFLDSKKLHSTHKDRVAREAYSRLKFSGKIDYPDLAYGIARGLYTFKEVEKEQEEYHLRKAREVILTYGISRIPDDERLYLDHCLEKGLISEEEVAKLDASRETNYNNIIDFDFRKDWF